MKKPKKTKASKRAALANKKKLPKGVMRSSFKITEEAIKRARPFPEEIEKEREALLGMAKEQPQKAIPRLKELKEKYPEVREISNWLSAALSAVGQKEEADALAKESFLKHPDYLFARMNYVSICLRDGNLEEIPKILDKFDLKMLYPDRDTFHVSEVATFYGITGQSHLASGNTDAALTCLNLLQEVAPDHRETLTLMLALAPTFYKTFLKNRIR